MGKRTPKDSIHYVDKEKLTNAVTEEAIKVRESIKAGEELPVISDYIAESIYKICTKLSYSGNFRNYTFIEDMVGDALVDCIASVKNFDPTKKTRSGKPNAFGYFTQIAWFAFLRRINNEKKNHEKQMKLKSTMTAADVSCQQPGYEDSTATQVLNSYIDEQIMFGLKNAAPESEGESEDVQKD